MYNTFLYRKVTSLPYSNGPTGWWGHRVCDVCVFVSGLSCRLKEVQQALHNLNNKSYDDNDSDYNPSADEDNCESYSTCKTMMTAHETLLQASSTNSVIIDNGSSTTTVSPICQVLYTCTPTRQSTKQDSDSDNTPIVPKHKLLRTPTDFSTKQDSDSPILPKHKLLCTPTRRSTKQDSDSDITPIVPKHELLRTPTHFSTKQDSDSDITPILPKHKLLRTPTRRSTKQDSDSDNTPIVPKHKLLRTPTRFSTKQKRNSDTLPVVSRFTKKKLRQQPQKLFDD